MAKPVVDRLEGELDGQGVSVVSLSAVNGLGRSLAGRYGVRGLPTLVVVDRQGEPTLRQVGRIQREGVLSAVAALMDN